MKHIVVAYAVVIGFACQVLGKALAWKPFGLSQSSHYLGLISINYLQVLEYWATRGTLQIYNGSHFLCSCYVAPVYEDSASTYGPCL
ncbi:hypothetical protein CsSME_00009123 [Camellia sinensis var. sinensis]